MARKDVEPEVSGEDTLTGAVAPETTGGDAEAVLNTDADAPAPEPIVPDTVTVDNAVTEDQLREKVSRMLKGRKNYELCGTLKSSPSAISNFVKGKGNVTKQMLAGLGVRPVVTYVIEDAEAFNALQG